MYFICLQTLRFLYCKSQIDFVAVCGSWLGFYHQHGTYVASISHISRISDVWSQLARSDLG
jgi:hypothetical protein